MATPEFARLSRRDQLGAFLDAVADYVDVDGDASLSGLLAYLQAEIEQGTGLEQAVPSDREAVKLLTVHKAKGLEWEVVFLPALMKGIFPSDRVTDNWVTNAAVLPADLRGDAGSIPQLAEATQRRADRRTSGELSEQQRLAEDRLAYVAATRAKQLLVGTGHTWRADLSNARSQSELPAGDHRRSARAGPAARPRPDRRAAQNPLVVEAAPRPWPAAAGSRRRWPAGRTRPLAVRAGAAPLRRDRELRRPGGRSRCCWTARRWWPAGTPTWTGCWSRLAESRGRDRPGATAGRSCRPRPCCGSARTRKGSRPSWPGRCRARRPGRPGSAPGSTSGSSATSTGGCRAAALGQQQLVDPDDLRDRADFGSHDELRAARAVRGVRGRAVRRRVPYAIEAPFTLLVAGRLVRGRIDAVYERRRDAGPGAALPGGRLEDRARRERRPAAAGDLPAGLGRGHSRSRPNRWTRCSTTCDRIDWSGPSGCPIGPSSSALLTARIAGSISGLG